MTDDTGVQTGLIRVGIKDYKCLYEVDLSIGPDVTEIGGPNESGKSSVLSAIRLILGGAKEAPIMPVRQGADATYIDADVHDVELGDLKLRYRQTEKGNVQFTVETAEEGAVFRKPREKIRALFGEASSFDPDRWQRLGNTPAGRRQQAEELRELLGIDTDAIDAEIDAASEHRREINTIAKNLGAQRDAIVVPENTPDEEVSILALSEELEKARRHNDQKADFLTDVANAAARVSSIGTEIKKADAKIVELQETLKKWEAYRVDKRKELGAWVQDEAICQKKVEAFESILVEPIMERMQDAEGINADVRAKINIQRLEGEVQVNLAEARKLTDTLDALKRRKHDMIEGVDFPIKGLGFSEDGVLYNGVDLATGCSGEERLRIATAVLLAQFKKQGVRNRLIIIENGSLMDPEHREMVREMCRAEGAQVIMELVSSEGSIIMEKGRVKDCQPQEAAETAAVGD